jgi:hypothetical protein
VSRDAVLNALADLALGRSGANLRIFVDPAQERYLRECDPRGRAEVVVDNTDPAQPRLHLAVQLG